MCVVRDWVAYEGTEVFGPLTDEEVEKLTLSNPDANCYKSDHAKTEVDLLKKILGKVKPSLRMLDNDADRDRVKEILDQTPIENLEELRNIMTRNGTMGCKGCQYSDMEMVEYLVDARNEGRL